MMGTSSGIWKFKLIRPTKEGSSRMDQTCFKVYRRHMVMIMYSNVHTYMVRKIITHF